MGTRQLSQVIGTIQNMPRIDELTGIGNNSTGAAMDAQIVWADSLEAKLQGLTNASQIFWQTFVNSDGAKGFIDMLTSIVNGATKLTETFGSVGVAAGALTAIFISFTNNPIKAWITSMITQNGTLIGTFGKLKTSLMSAKTAIVNTGTATTLAGKATTVMSNAFTFLGNTALFAQIKVMALQMALTMGLSFAIMAVVGGLSSLISSFTGAEQKLKEFNEETTKSSQDITKQITDIEELTKTMISLENEIANADNSDVQAQKKKELLDVQAQIAEILPETASGYDSEGRAIATNIDLVKDLLKLKNDERQLKADEFFDKNGDMQNKIREQKELRKEYEAMLEAKKKGEKISGETLVPVRGQMVKVKQEYEVDDKQLMEANKKLMEGNKLFAQAKIQIEAYKSAGMSDSAISEKLGYDISLLDEVIVSADGASDSMDGLGNSSNGASDGLENIVVKLGDVTANAADAASEIERLGDKFSEFTGNINLAEKALEEFNKYGGLTIETKDKILNSGDSRLISFLADETTMAKNLNGYIKDNKRLRDETEQAAIANAVADQEGKKYLDEKNRAVAEQNAKLDEQKGKIDAVNQAQAEASANVKNKEEGQSYEADKTAKVTAEQEKTRVTNEESDKRKAKLQEEAQTKYDDVENKATAEQQKTTNTTAQSNARIAETQNETTQNQASYNTDVTNHKASEDKKVADTTSTMSSISSAVSSGMSGLSTHYNTNATNFASSLTSMESSARTSVSNINTILAGIKQPTIKAPTVSGGGASPQNLERMMPNPQMSPMSADEMVTNFRVDTMRAINPVSEVVGDVVNSSIGKLPTTATINPNILNTATEEEKRRQAEQIGSAVGSEISEVMPRVMASRAMANTPMAAKSRGTVITVNPNKIVSTVNPGKKPSSNKKKPTTKKKTTSSSSKSSSTKKEEKVDIKDLEDEIDRYKALDDALNDVNHAISMNSKLREHASSKDKYAYHYEELKLLEQKKKAITDLQNAEQKEMAELEKKLKANGFNPSNGNMTNYTARLEQLKKEVNAMADTNKAKEDAKKKYEDLKKSADRYFEVSKDLQKHKEDWQDTVNAIKDAQIKMEEEAASEVEEIRDKLVDALKNKYEQMRDVQLSDLDKEIERLQKQLDDLDKQADDKKGRLAKLEAERAKWSKDDSAYGKAKVEELNKQIEELQREIQKDEIQASIDDLEKEKDKVNEHYDNLLSDKNIYAEANKLLSQESQETLLAMLTEYAPDYAHIGELWGKSFKDEFNKQLQEAKDALDFLQGKLDQNKKPSTPAPTPTPPPVSNPTPPPAPSNNTAVKKGDKVKVTNGSASIYTTSTTGKSSGNWTNAMKATGASMFYIVNTGGNRVALSPNGKMPATGWIDKKNVAKFSRGGLTGDWSGNEGKIAELHQKEAILNKNQAKIFYDNATAKYFEDFVKMLPSVGNMFDKVNVGTNDNVEQNITIETNITINGKADTFDMKREGDSISKKIAKELNKIGFNKKRR